MKTTRYDQITLFSDTGLMKTAGIFIYNKARAHTLPRDLLGGRLFGKQQQQQQRG